ncbi:MAG: cytochrome c nitrite reductase small subunit [Bacteroidetes bacterium]|nr:cytochrome c nitrite reductase small subunit [Bacteroidota bacterium]
MNPIFRALIPPTRWRRPVVVALGIIAGLSLFLFYISNAASYLSDNPKTCTNCHVMNPQFATWQHSSHREVTNCNDCHVPHDNVVRKYFFKTQDGLRHATIFTLRTEPDVIMIKEMGQRVVHENCIRCHLQVLENPEEVEESGEEEEAEGEVEWMQRKCWECHREAPHGTVKGLASVPHAMITPQKPPVPEWLKKLVK